MKYSQYEQHQRDSLKEFLLQIMSFYKQEEMMFVQSSYRLLILANGSAIFLVSAYLGALVSGGRSTEGFGFPLFLFFVGLISAGFILQYSLGVAHTVMSKTSEQVLKVFKDELDLENFQAWGFSPKGLVTIGVAQLISAVCFLLGAVVVLLRI